MTDVEGRVSFTPPTIHARRRSRFLFHVRSHILTILNSRPGAAAAKMQVCGEVASRDEPAGTKHSERDRAPATEIMS